MKTVEPILTNGTKNPKQGSYVTYLTETGGTRETPAPMRGKDVGQALHSPAPTLPETDTPAATTAQIPSSFKSQVGNLRITLMNHFQLLASPTESFSLRFLFVFKITYLFIWRRRRREKERERNINMWLPLAHPALGTRPATQACVLTGN